MNRRHLAKAAERQRRQARGEPAPVHGATRRQQQRPRPGATAAELDPRYRTSRWQALSAQIKQERPWCEGECEGFWPSKYADHVIEVRDDTSDANFFDPGNVQALCGKCHWRKTKREEARRRGLPEPKLPPVDCGVDPATGLPLSPQHWWNG